MLLMTRRLLGTARRTADHIAMVAELILARLLNEPKVIGPGACAGSGETGGASAGGAKQRNVLGRRIIFSEWYCSVRPGGSAWASVKR